MTDRLPWNEALAAAARKQAALLEEANSEIDRLKETIAGLRLQLQNLKLRQDNWRLRQEAWRRERNELLRRLDTLGARTGPAANYPTPEENGGW